MVKRLELVNAKLKTQLAEARETKLLNLRHATDGETLRHEDPNEEAALAEAFGVVHVKQDTAPAKMPWE